MKKRRTLSRILVEAVAVVILHAVFLQMLAKARLLEHLLAPGGNSFWAIAATVGFLAFRVFLYLLGPGLLLCRLWFWATRNDKTGPVGTPTTKPVS
ncbi:MAG: hypothetical protein QM790_16690 [Nibricoccus sp.]